MFVQRRGDNAHEWELYRGAGRIGIEWYFKETTSLPISVMQYHLEPGAEEGQHFHLEGAGDSCSPGSSDEMYVVTAGEVVISSDEQRRVLRAGDAFYAPQGARHGVRNESDAPAELILVFGPRGPHPFTQTGREAFDAEADR
ncbi:cupin domain-containing protein [Microbacterium murale]|uniref:Quercetin dioxygenase-like cupin family protein n=1 Tax=Microbacterium murale TaxID=1081040 RepID=A0ABU0P758_9MICO|nr:cupin domain-containing protein [Microbacterium murale]MDQ0642727.1 quercetin dioxygenase-like cupin family protein [Microbacterium murale]